MNLASFKASLAQPEPPADLSPELQALWHDARGHWDGAHEVVQERSSTEAAWVHAYLHRKEGDPGNARYWYQRAGQPECRLSLQEEWDAIAEALLGDT